MKLYTEFEVTKAVAITLNYDIKCTDDVLEKLTPIELPSDEEIEKRAESYCEHVFSYGMLHGASNHTRQGYIQSAKWMKGQILNQNK